MEEFKNQNLGLSTKAQKAFDILGKMALGMAIFSFVLTGVFLGTKFIGVPKAILELFIFILAFDGLTFGLIARWKGKDGDAGRNSLAIALNAISLLGLGYLIWSGRILWMWEYLY